MLKKSLYLFLGALFLLSSCSKDKKVTPTQGNKEPVYPGKWTKTSDLPLQGRETPLTISYNNKGYVIGGNTNGDPAETSVLEYDPANDKWTKKTNYPGHVYQIAAGFLLNGKIYVGTGFNRVYSEKDTIESNEFYEYDIAGDKWTKKADFPGPKRIGAVGFSIGDAGYMGLGGTYNNNLKFRDIYKYDPAADKWLQVADYPGSSNFRNTAFTSGDKGYVGLGVGNIFYYVSTDLWMYEPASNTWTQKSTYPGSGGGLGASLMINGKPYFVSLDTGDLAAEAWTYDITTDKWSRIANMPGAVLECLMNFSFNNTGYIFSGYSLAPQSLYKFEP